MSCRSDFLDITALSISGCGSFTGSLSAVKKEVGNSLSVDEKDALVMFSVLICGATDSAPLLPENLGEALVSEPDDMPKSLRHDDPPLLLESFLKLDVDEIFVEKCLKNLWTRGMQPTMIPIDISAKLTVISIRI